MDESLIESQSKEIESEIFCPERQVEVSEQNISMNASEKWQKIKTKINALSKFLVMNSNSRQASKKRSNPFQDTEPSLEKRVNIDHELSAVQEIPKQLEDNSGLIETQPQTLDQQIVDIISVQITNVVESVNQQKEDEADDDDEEDYEDEEEDEQDEEGGEGNNDCEGVDKGYREEIFVTEAVLENNKQEEIKSNSVNQQGVSNCVQFEMSNNDEQMNIKICDRVYIIDLTNQIVRDNEQLIDIVNNITDMAQKAQEKQLRQMPELSQISKHTYLSALEYYLMHTLNQIKTAAATAAGQPIKDVWQEEICCICQCELFNDISSMTKNELFSQLENDSDDDPINLEHCEAHYFHKECLRQMLQSTASHLKCPVCSKIYGVMTGDQPPGKMSIYVDRFTRCGGYEKYATIVIQMQFHSTQKNGQYVPSTARVGYLPNNLEGRKVLEMLKTAFKRRLIFTIGRSVTTGKDNRIIWNGIHFKTDTQGGSSNFGYPDPTYLQRVTQELSFKGIYPPLD